MLVQYPTGCILGLNRGIVKAKITLKKKNPQVKLCVKLAL